MATTTSITTSYIGENSARYVSAALLSANSLENGGLTILPNIKYKQVINKIGIDAILKDATCDFTATSTVTLTERVLTVEDFQVNLQLCKKDYHNTWMGLQQGFSAHDTLPKSFSDYLIALVADKVAATVETNIWSGATATSGAFDGFEVLLAADAALPTANEVAGAAVSSATIIVELGKIVDAIPAAVYGNEGLRIYASRAIVKAYIRALGGFGTSGLGGNGVNAQGTQWYTDGSLSFDGIPIFMASGMTSTVAICTYPENLYFGCSILSDLNEVKVIDMSEMDGSQNVRVIMRMGMGIQYANVSDIVTYGITNAAN
jgi:hypothetical protein